MTQNVFTSGAKSTNGTPSFVQMGALKRRRSAFKLSFGLFLAPLPDDSIGSATTTFSGVNAGSEIRVYLPDTTEAAGIETCAADQVLSWPVYASGSPNNTVRIVIVHPNYKIKEFAYTASVGNQSIPVQQELDKWYSNP